MAKKLDKLMRVAQIKPECRFETNDNNDGKLILEGYPIVFNQETEIGDIDSWGWIESVDRHAFDTADIRMCCLKYNHESGSPVMARVRNGSLTLTADDYGVFMHAELLEDDRHFYNRVKSGLIDQMSFCFTASEEERTLRNGNMPEKRIIKRIDKLFDVAIVDEGAYPQTSVEARNNQLAQSQARAEAVPVELENSTTKGAKLENRANEGQEAQCDNGTVETVSNELENSNNQEAKPDNEEERKAFEFRKKKAITLLKLGGKWYD